MEHGRRWIACIVLATFGTSLVAEHRVLAAPQTTPPPPITLPNAPPRRSPQELRDLVAPVALYPDVVLASLLPATTFPEQVHDAAQWVSENAGGSATPPDDRGWDGSVVALLQFPDVVRWLDANREWTDEMGRAVTYQQGDVLDAIQAFRRSAADAGNLSSNQYQTVQAQPGRDIRIVPAQPDVVYVPSYDPALAVQPQPAVQSPGINPWIAFGGGAVVGALGAWALYSIFDDDDDHDHYHGYHGSRRINYYDNYYYAGGRRRPARRQWNPRPLPYESRRYRGGVARPGRLEHVSTRSAEPMRAPSRRPEKQRSSQANRQRANAGGQRERPKQKPAKKRTAQQQSRQGSKKKQQGQRAKTQGKKKSTPQEKKQGKHKKKGEQEARAGVVLA